MLVNEILNVKNTENFDEFMSKYRELGYQKSFATNETVKHDLRTNGLISTYDLLNELSANSTETVNDVEEFISEYGNLEILQDSYDNTYNYNGYLDRYVEFNTFELENDQFLATFSVGLGLDPRAAYTKQVALVFENDYDIMESLDTQFELLDFEFTANGKRYYGGFDGSALNEFGYLNIDDQGTSENVYCGESILDTSDVDDIKDVVAEIMKIDKNKISIDKVNYFWYAS